jgi:hypothetical protein
MTRGPAWALLVVATALSVAGCRPDAVPAEGVPVVDAGWVMIPPTEMRQSGTLAHPRLAEASGAAVTTQRPGALWTLNDSGNAPDLYLIDTSGALLTSFPLLGATNTDWEEVALGTCPAGRCLYIADTGDNAERRSEVLIHRVAEPDITVTLPSALPGQQPQTLRVRYPDGPHDVEAMAVTRAGEVLLVSKGRSGGVLLFRLPPSAWSLGSAIAERIDSLPIVANSGIGRLVTGMALSPDGTRLMVRTYRDLYPFAVNADLTLRPLGRPTACDILGREPQGEAIDWLDDQRLVLTSERGLMKAGTVFLVRCSV